MPVTISDDVLAAAHLSEAELRLELAVALFREERLTMAQACRLAEIDQLAFQAVLAEREIPIHYGIEEFRQDLRTIDSLETFEIDHLEEGYTVLTPIPVEIRRVDEASFLASVPKANIAITGSSVQDAYQSLVAEILDSFDTLRGEPNLTGDAAEQLRALSRYIAKA